MTGKEKCQLFKQIRARIARENCIEGFEYKACPSEGDCLGVCPACDKETADLQKILDEKGVDITVPSDLVIPKELQDMKINPIKENCVELRGKIPRSP